MNKTQIPGWALERVMARRGTLHPYADLDPRRTALIAIDMQNAYLSESTAHAYCQHAVDIIPNINRIAQALRTAGGKVFWISHVHDASWVTLYAKMRPENVTRRAEALRVGSAGYALHPSLDVQPDDAMVPKWRFSAFIAESSDLAVRLRAAGCDTVLITGTLTNVCCESSARDAMMMNFHSIMVSDANAAITDEEHNASLTNFYTTFGDVMDTDFLLGCLAGKSAGASAAA